MVSLNRRCKSGNPHYRKAKVAYVELVDRYTVHVLIS
jgi:hypothetical protein